MHGDKASAAVRRAVSDLSRSQTSDESLNHGHADISGKSPARDSFSQDEYGHESGGLGHDSSYGIRNFGPEDNVTPDDQYLI